jgi:hypothetical protein
MAYRELTLIGTEPLRLHRESLSTAYISFAASSSGALSITPALTPTVVTFGNSASLAAVAYKRTSVTQSTAASTALSARGVVELGTSSTTAAANWILTQPGGVGEELHIVVKLNGSTFGVTVNASTATTVTFGAVAATTGQIRAVLPGSLGNSLSLVSLSTAQWLVLHHVGATFSTAAA